MRRLTSVIAACMACLALSAQETRVSFAFMTDLHYAQGAAAGTYLEECIDHINSQDSLAFVIVGGDLTDFGSDEEIADVKAILDHIRKPYHVVAGNHDAKWSESGCNTFLKVFGYEHFEFEAGGWRFLGCNCGPDMRMAPALLPKESMVWLDGLDGGRKSVFVNHYPQDTSVLNYFDVTRSLKKAGVQFEIGGHWHSNRALNYDGIPAVLGRSTLPTKGRIGYNVFTFTDSTVTVHEVNMATDGSDVQICEPWYSATLAPVVDRTSYDADGIAESYPWIRYDVNSHYPQVSERWKVSDDANIVSGTARKGRTVYHTTTSGCVRAISLRSGRRRWSAHLPGKIFSTPAVSGRYLVLGCSDGNIYALSRFTGRILWQQSASKSVLGSPVIRDGKVYIGASDGCFRALNLRDGSVAWINSDIEGFIESTPLVDDEQVVFGTWANRLYSLDPLTGQLQWVWKSHSHSRMCSPAATVPVKSCGRIFVAVPDRRVYAVDAATGADLFWVRGGREAIGLSEDGSEVYAKTMFHHSFAFPASVPADSLSVDGELPQSLLTWNVENGMGYEISPTAIVEKDGVVYFPTDKGNLFALSAEDGSLLWIHKISLALINPIDVWKDRRGTHILASTMDGVLTLMDVAE